MEKTSTHPRPAGSRRFRISAVFLAASAVLGVPAWLGRAHLAMPPGAGSLPFSYPYTAVMGADGSIAVSDTGERRILMLSPGGELRASLVSSRSGGFFNGRPLGFDAEGSLYVDDSITDLASSGVQSRRILRYGRDGRLQGTVAAFDFRDGEMIDWELHPLFAQIRGDNAYWFKKDASGDWYLVSYGLTGDGTAWWTPLPDMELYSMIGAAVRGHDEAYFLRPDGGITRWTASGGLDEAWMPAGPEGTGLRFPVRLSIDAWGRLLASDAKTRVVRVDPAAAVPAAETIFDGAARGRSGGTILFQSARAAPDGSLVLSDETDGAVVIVDADGDTRFLDGAAFSPRYAVAHLAAWACAVLSALLALAAVVLFYARILTRHTPLIVRQLFIMLPVIALMVAAVAAFVYGTMAAPLAEQVRERLLHVAHSGASRLPRDSLASLRLESRGYRELLDLPAYRDAVAVLDELVNLNEDPWDDSIFIYLYVPAGGSWWIIGSFDYTEPYPYAKPEFSQAMDSGEYRYYRYEDVYGAWLSALVPVKDEDGRPMALLEACMSADDLDEASRLFVRRAAMGGGLILVVFLSMLSGFTWYLLKSVKKLQKGVEKVSAGDYDISVRITSKDELEDLGNAFNGMSGEIRQYVARLAEFSRANARFVPKEFIERLQRQSITDVKLGDQALMDMTVLFSDIREFTSLAERYGPRNTVDILNEYLSRMGPVVRAHGGFIDKYIGDAIMALFPYPVDRAAVAVMDMMESLDGFREALAARGLPPLDAGFGIHAGPLMLGIIGEAERYDGTVIADTVNLASRLESLTKLYGVRSLMSGTCARSLADRSVRIRFLDQVRVKGRQEPVSLYEIVARGDPLGDAKLAASKAYREAFRAYAAAEFSAAEEAFSSLASSLGDDPPSALLRDRCRRFRRDGAPEGWDGVTILHEK